MSKYKADRSGPESSAYWGWIQKHQASDSDGTPYEARDANPDQLNEEEVLIQKTELTEEQEDALNSYYKLIEKGVLKKLSPRQREVWRLKFFSMLTDEEISKKLDLNLSSVRVHVARAAAKIRAELEKQQLQKDYMAGKYFNDGFKKNSHEVGEAKTDKLMAERLSNHRAEIESFCKKHPELKSGKTDETST